METTEEIIKAPISIPEAIQKAKAYILSGEVDPLEMWANMSRYEKMFKAVKDDPQVKDYALRELSKYGSGHQLHDCKLEESEAGVKYDYSVCGDSTLTELYETRAELDQQIKERETMLRGIPVGQTVADTETGEELRRPVRSSKTTIKVTFNKTAR